jgi:hypothetical protein
MSNPFFQAEREIMLSLMTDRELMQVARDRNIPGRSGMRKSDLINSLLMLLE